MAVPPPAPLRDTSGAVQRVVEAGKLNVVGEDHNDQKEKLPPDDRTRRSLEKQMLVEDFGFGPDQYWLEYAFRFGGATQKGTCPKESCQKATKDKTPALVGSWFCCVLGKLQPATSFL